MIPTKEENPTGLFQRYNISRTDGTEINPNAEYFILRLDGHSKDKSHVTACRLAVLAYADAIAPTKPKMAQDIYERYNAHPVDGAMLKTEPHM